MKTCFLNSIALAVLMVVLSHGGPSRGATDDKAKFFENNVEPLLKEKCLACHSHASKTMEGGLTLDSKQGWSVGGDLGPAVVPGDAEGSLLRTAIRYGNPDLQMPPDGQLDESEIAIFEKWIETGAFDPRVPVSPQTMDDDWWSLVPLETPNLPGSGHPIDAFIERRLNEQGIVPSKKADRVTLIRRAYVDLHGYLPTPQEVQAFVDDESLEAFDALLDQLLESPRYGERWARHWLDTVHFADSHGCEHDVKRDHAWRYRDYVIERLNEDVSWSQFIDEQLAPDVFEPNMPQRLAGLGFLAAGPLELSRAGTAPVTFDYLDRDDMVTQTMAAFVSTTANCARCHTHKFDPITQEDYYALQAVFAGVGKGDVEFDVSTEVMQRRQELESIARAVSSRDSELLLSSNFAPIVEAWLKRQTDPVEWTNLDPGVFVSAGGATLTKLADQSILASGLLPDQEHYTVTAPLSLPRLTAVRIETLRDESLPMNGPGRAENGNLHLTEVLVHWIPDQGEVSTALEIRRASADFDQAGWTANQAIDGNLESGWAIFPEVNQSHHIVLELAEPVEVGDGGKLVVTLKQLHPPKHVIGRFRIAVTDSDDAARVLPADARDALKKSADQRSDIERMAIAAVALGEYSEEQLTLLPPQDIVYGVSPWWSHAKKLESPQTPKVVHLLRRGAFDQPVREVGPGALSAIDALPGRFSVSENDDEAARRAALARWLRHRDNPLTWRSIVNRVWHYHFGRGLVDTPNDFGRMGSKPTHPELLDWLAVWFRDEAEGSLKELHRLIMTSETWQRSNVLVNRDEDRENRWLGRMSRQRMDADVFRDSALRVSGQLDLKMGGPGIEQFLKTKGPQATPTLDYQAFDWTTPGATRRSIYRVVWRGIPDPFMEALDFPELGLLAPKRGFSVSALQSLTLYNNDFVLQVSDWLAQRVQQEHQTLEDQIARAVQLTWLRDPDAGEQSEFHAYADEHGLAALCRVLLNSNEFLFVD